MGLIKFFVLHKDKESDKLAKEIYSRLVFHTIIGLGD